MVPFTKTVAAAGTPERIFTKTTDPKVFPKQAKAIFIQAHHDNTGKIFVGKAGIVKATFANVMFVLGIPGATPTFIDGHLIALDEAPNGLAIEDLFVDADVSTDGVVGYYLVQ